MPYANESLEEYRQTIERLRYAFWVQDLEKNMKRSSWKIPVITPVIDAISMMTVTLANIVSELIVISGSTRAKNFMLQCEMIQESISNTLSSISKLLLLSSQPEKPDVLSDEYMKTGFEKAFEYIKHVSWELSEINITSASILIPDFLDARIRGLVRDAALETGIDSVGVQSPQELVRQHGGILDEVAAPFQFDERPQRRNEIMIDYGLRYLHLHTRSGRCRMERVLDEMSCSRVPHILYHRVISLDESLSRQVAKGASKNDLFEALWRARFAMKQPIEQDEDQQQDHYEEWPLDLQDWWIGEDEGAVLRWEDVQAAEEDYVDLLSDILNQALDCVQGESSKSVSISSKGHTNRNNVGQENEHGVRPDPIHRVIVLGNFCDRALVKKAIKKSVGEHVNIIGGSTEQDNALAAKGGARFALQVYDVLHSYERARMLGLGHDEL